jgi:hypothetical protein
VKVPNASWDDMNDVLWFPSDRHSGHPDDDAWEALLADGLLPDDADETARAVSEVLAILAGAPPGPGELRGEARAMTAFRDAVGMSNPSRPRHRRRPSVLTSLLGARLGAAVAAGVLGVGGFATAAYAGSLPAVAQNFAHAVLGAPAANGQGRPGPEGAPTTTPVGPDATANAAFGLCTAYEHAQVNGSAADQALAFSDLATAAGGAGNITAYCVNVPHPGATNPSTNPTGQLSSLPSHPSSEPSSLPTYPSGEPSSLPTYPSGEPSSLPSHPSGPPTSLPTHPTGKPTS